MPRLVLATALHVAFASAVFAQVPVGSLDPRIAALVDAVSAERLAASVERLAAFNDAVGGAAGGSGLANTSTVRVFTEGPEDSRSRSRSRRAGAAAGN